MEQSQWEIAVFAVPEEVMSPKDERECGSLGFHVVNPLDFDRLNLRWHWFHRKTTRYPVEPEMYKEAMRVSVTR